MSEPESPPGAPPSPPAGGAVAVRPAARADCGAIRDIYNHYVLEDTCTWATEPETLDERLDWFDHHGPDHPVFVAEADGRVIGWASLSVYNPRRGYRRTVENSIYLDPRWRGRGVGGRLLARLIAAARERGHHTIIAGISAEQAASVALHAKHGFVHAGRLVESGFKQGRWLDVIYMQLLLRSADPTM
jgi:phosphinothricin acetyltransferase